MHDRRGRSSAASARASTGCCSSSCSAVFIAGLMVGRTPEYLGKKIEAREIKLVVLGTIVVPLLVLVTTALAIATKYWRAVDLRLRARRASPRRSTPTSRRPTTTARRSPATPATCSPNGTQRRRVRHHVRRPARRPDDAGRALHAAPRGARRSPARSPASASRPPAPGTLRTDTPTFVVLLVGVGADRRAAHLRPRPAPRTRRPGHDRPALLSMRELRTAAPGRGRLHRPCSASPTRSS